MLGHSYLEYVPSAATSIPLPDDHKRKKPGVSKAQSQTEEFLGSIHGRWGTGGSAVSADLLGEVGRNWRSADHDLHLIAQSSSMALIVWPIARIVVVSRADMPTMSGPKSLIASRN
jgi:hypothetical protein